MTQRHRHYKGASCLFLTCGTQSCFGYLYGRPLKKSLSDLSLRRKLAEGAAPAQQCRRQNHGAVLHSFRLFSVEGVVESRYSFFFTLQRWARGQKEGIVMFDLVDA